MILIKNTYLKPITSEDINNADLLIGDDGKIAEIGIGLTAPDGAEIIDAEGRLTTPGLIEAHSHLGIHEAVLDWQGRDVNERTDPITPHMSAIDGINPSDEYIGMAIKYGVTTACINTGSSNVVGGSSVAIKLHGNCIDKMIIKYPAAMKCAFGENPKNAHGQSSKRMPYTRMGIAALLRDLLEKSKNYLADKENGKNPSYDAKLEAMIPVMKKEIPLKAHAHRSYDILTAIRIAKEYDVNLTLDHCTEGHLITEEIRESGFPAIVGPSMGGKSKPELIEKTFETAGILHKAGIPVCITTDAPVSPQHYLPLCAGLAVSYGLPMEEGWRAITITPAKVIGVSDRVGSLEVGKDADIVIWTADPLTTVGARAALTIMDGKVIHRV